MDFSGAKTFNLAVSDPIVQDSQKCLLHLNRVVSEMPGIRTCDQYSGLMKPPDQQCAENIRTNAQIQHLKLKITTQSSNL